jgi:hypothetical protein
VPKELRPINKSTGETDDEMAMNREEARDLDQKIRTELISTAKRELQEVAQGETGGSEDDNEEEEYAVDIENECCV